jgi:hypothetical protein
MSINDFKENFQYSDNGGKFTLPKLKKCKRIDCNNQTEDEFCKKCMAKAREMLGSTRKPLFTKREKQEATREMNEFDIGV